MRVQGGYRGDTVRAQWGTLGHSEGSVGVQGDTVNVQSGNNGPPCGGNGR